MKDKDAELREEIQAHLDMATADRIERGATREDATAAARRELGNLSQIQEATRDVWGRRWIEDLLQDLRYALRTFRRNPGFAAVAVVSLALGIGANAALFEMVDAVSLSPLPVDDPSTLVEVRIDDDTGARGNFLAWHPAVTYPIWDAIRTRQQALSGVFAWGADTFNLADGGEIRPARGLWVSGDFFTVLGIHPALGRVLAADDDRSGCPARAVLGHAFWQRAYGGDPGVIGRAITLNTRRVEIVGVAPAGFHGLEVGRAFDVALPVCAEPRFSENGKGRLQAGTTWWLSVFGRLRPGWTVERASAQLASISPDVFRSTLPPTYPAISVDKYLHFTLGAHPGGAGLSRLRDQYSTPLLILLAIAGLVLTTACANLANLLLARATSRQREFAVRLGLGASRGRIVRQLLTEGLLLSAIGTAAALLVATSLSRALLAFLDPEGSRIVLAVGLDWRVAVFAIALAALTSLLFSLAPAINGTRIGATAVLSASARGATASRDTVGLRRVLVVAQVALSVVLLFCSLLFVRSLRNVAAVDPGFRPEGIVIARVDFRRLGLPPERQADFRRELAERVGTIPGVQGAAPVRVVPISGNSGGNELWLDGNRAQPIGSLVNMVGSGYFSAMGIPIVAGRDFDGRDAPNATPVAIVNEAFAALQVSGRPIVGAHVTREATPGDPEETFEVVGVVKNSTYVDLKEQVSPTVYYADAQSGDGASTRLVVRSSLPPARVSEAVTGLLHALDPRIAVAYSVMTTDIRETLVRERLLAVLSAGFGGLAALLTVVGLYGIVAYSVTRRTNEIGMRMALGARPIDIAQLVVREIGLLLAVGLAAGIAAALAAARTASSLLFGIGSSDPVTMLLAVTLLAAIAAAAAFVPTRRATGIDPAIALRAD